LPYFEISTTGCKAVHPITVNHVLGTCDAKDHCRRESGADCSDLGSAHVWNVAQRLSIPMIPARSISDAKNSDTPFPGDMLKFILETLDPIRFA
jgi:nucleoside phosphorylase